MKKSFTFAFIASLIMSMQFMQPSLAAVPRSSNDLLKDATIYKNLREIRITKEKSLDFDQDIARLSAQEKSYRKALPLRLSKPMERVLKTSYQPGSKLQKGVRLKRQKAGSH